MDIQFKADLKPATEKIHEMKAKKVMLQVPEGLKMKALAYMDELAGEGVDVYLAAEPCFGACDLADRQAVELGCDLLVHVGHSEMHKSMLPTVFIKGTYVFDTNPIFSNIVDFLKKTGYKKISLATTAQYSDYLEPLQKHLNSNGFEALIGEHTQRTSFNGQVLGCSFGSVLNTHKKADAVLYFGDGLFHPLGIALTFEIPCIWACPMTSEVKSIEDEKRLYLKKRWMKIGVARQAEKWGIVVGLKEGQFRPYAEQLKKRLEAKGKTAYLIQMDFASPNYVVGMTGKGKIEALVCVSCPRIPIDDEEMWGKIPFLTIAEMELSIGEDERKKYEFDQMNLAKYPKLTKIVRTE